MPRIHLVTTAVSGQEQATEAPNITIRHLPCVIGRSTGCDYRINDPMISRTHCELSLREGQVWVQDLHSLNGTRIDGKRLLGPESVTDGARLQLGPFTFVMRMDPFTSDPHSNTDGLAGARTGELGSPH
jgi:pSer/pThr/pTyr-binding forkhead associated (FHA) protein